jgi:hypothetical protein
MSDIIIPYPSSSAVDDVIKENTEGDKEIVSDDING